MSNKTRGMLEDRIVDVKVRLALLWVALMFFYMYNDIFSILQPGHAAELVKGQLEGIRFTQSMLFCAAVLMAFPGFMVLLSLSVKARANRVVNIIVGSLHIFVLFGTQFIGQGGAWFYWRFYELLELLFIVSIIWTAWKWPAAESKNQ